MNKLRKLTAAVLLAFLIGLPAFAGQTETAPCSQPAPGQMETPPCQAAANADLSTPTSSSTISAETEVITEVVADVLGSMLSIF